MDLSGLGDKIRKALDDGMVSYVAKRNSLIVDCPVCGKEQHTWIRLSDGATKCWVCQKTYDAAGIISALTSQSREKVYSLIFGSESGERLANYSNPLAHISFGFPYESGTEDGVDLVSAVNLDYLNPAKNNQEVTEYLSKRGISAETAELLDVRAHSFIAAPFFIQKGFDGNTYGYQYRKIHVNPGEPKTITLQGFQKNRFLLFMDKAFSHSEIALVEGPFDAAKCWQAGLPAVACYGKAVSHEQIELLLQAGAVEAIYVGLDRDADKETKQVIAALSRIKRVFRLLPPEHRDDLGACTPDEIRELKARAIECTGNPSELLEVFMKL